MRRLSICCGLAAWGLVACHPELDSSQGAEVFTATMSGTVTGTVSASPTDIPCDGSTQVTVTLVGETGIAGNAVDIMLVLDRSGSMEGSIGQLKSASRSFVDMIDEATDGVLDGNISNGSRIGVVSFSTNATLDRSLTSDANQVKAAINGLTASGLTNHAAGIQTAQGQLASSPNHRLMIIFTDGVTTAGGNPAAAAVAAKNAGTEIFGIGLGSVNAGAIQSWVSTPVATHAYFTTDASTLEQIFEAIGAAITVPAGTNIAVALTTGDGFTASGASASKGSVAAGPSNITWSIPKLQTETVSLTYTATHDNLSPGGVRALHASLSYSDAEGHQVVFPALTVNVRGCAATLELTPEVDTNIVGDPHTVIATVLDDFDDPVAGVNVSFSVAGGPSIVDGEDSAPVPAAGAGVTGANGQVSFTYTNSQASQDVITAVAPVQPNVWQELMDTARKTWRPIPVCIDIKPGSDPSSFGASSRGQIPVALLGAEGFDLAGVDDGTVRFGDAPSAYGDAAISHARGHFEQVNGDGLLDKVFHFYFPDTHLDPGDTVGCLSGEVNGRDFMGCSDVNIVPN